MLSVQKDALSIACTQGANYLKHPQPVAGRSARLVLDPSALHSKVHTDSLSTTFKSHKHSSSCRSNSRATRHVVSQLVHRDAHNTRSANVSTESSSYSLPIAISRLQNQLISSLDDNWILDGMQLSHSTENGPPDQDITGWSPFQKLVAAALDKVESSFIAHLEEQHPLPSTADPRVQLAGNFAPVPERPAQHELQVEGRIPDCLEGVYVRNGANPLFEPIAGHHFFDGDGMLHAVRFKQGIASYCCRFTRTHRLIEEQKLGRAFFPKAIGELHGHSGVARLLLFYARSLFGLVDGNRGMGVANAGVVFFNGHLLAMSEDDLPYAVKITNAGDLETLGRYNFGGQLSSAMIAHPKVDARTGEMFALSYDVIKKPYLKYFKFSSDGTKGPEVTISMAKPTMIHDFAITEKFVIIPDQQVVFRLQEMLTGGSPVVLDKDKMPRFGILPRDDADESRLMWIDVPDCFCFHLWNAWEENEEVVVVGSCMTPADSIFNESDQPLRSVLSEIRLNMRTGASSRRELASINLEAGQVNRNYLGKKSRYAYLAIAEPWPRVSGIAKVDLNAGGSLVDTVVAKIEYSQGCYGGEPMFVPRTSDPAAPEDDGYVLTFLHNEETGRSELLVLDARSPSLERVASIKLPSRVPYGFHGTFISSQELDKQKS